MVAPLERGECDAVFGSRMMIPGAARRGGMPMYKCVGNKILTRVENRLLGSRLTEFHSGYRAYRVGALAELPFERNTDDFDFDTQIIVQLARPREADRRRSRSRRTTATRSATSTGLQYARDVVARRRCSTGSARSASAPGSGCPAGDEYDLKEGEGTSHTVDRRHARPTSRRSASSTSAAPAAGSPSGCASSATT